MHWLPRKSFTLDGESVVCGGDGIAVFADLYRRGVVTAAMLYASDLLEFGGEHLRPFPLSDRKRLHEARR
jgi:ATP-dependent DNA ligase